MERIRMNRRRWGAVGGVGALIVVVAIGVSATGDNGTNAEGDAQSTDAESDAQSKGDGGSPATSDPPSTTASNPALTGEPHTSTPEATTTQPDSPPPSLVEVPVGTVLELPPIDLDDIGDFGNGLVVRLVALTAVTGEATGLGEVAGPAVRITFELTNTGDETLSLLQTMVDVTYGDDRTPGLSLSGPDVIELPDSLDPGESSTASVVFAVPLDNRKQVQVVVRNNVDAPIVVFEGPGP